MKSDVLEFRRAKEVVDEIVRLSSPTPRRSDLTGLVLGRIIVLGETNMRDKSCAVMWAYRCECGNLGVVSTGSLRRSKRPTRSCGCLHRSPPVVGGQRFCVHCHNVKSIEEFPVNPKKFHGIESFCVDCLRAYRASYYEIHKDVAKARAKDWYQSMRSSVLAGLREKKGRNKPTQHLKDWHRLSGAFLSDTYVRVSSGVRKRHQDAVPEVVDVYRSCMIVNRGVKNGRRN